MNPIRVMVVDDSVVVRKIVTDVLSADPDIEVVGTAVNGKVAVAKLEQLKPDLITMDIEMPEMNGIEAVRAHPRPAARNRVPIIMFSTLTERGASATLDALSAGANDYVTKPANVGSVGQSMEQRPRAADPQDQGARPAARSPLGPGPRRRRRPPAAARRAAHRPGQEARRPGHRLLHRRPRGAGPGARRRCRVDLPVPGRCSSSTCRRSSPGSSPSAWTGSAPCASSRPPTAARCVPGTRPPRPRRPPPRRPRPARRACTPASTRARRRTSAARPSTCCSARRSPPTTAPSSASCSPAWAPTAATAPARSAPPAAPCVVQDEATSVVWGMPGAVARPASPTRSCPLDRIADAITRHLVRRPPARAGAGRRRRPAMTLTATSFDWVRALVRKESAIVLAAGQGVPGRGAAAADRPAGGHRRRRAARRVGARAAQTRTAPGGSSRR